MRVIEIKETKEEKKETAKPIEYSLPKNDSEVKELIYAVLKKKSEGYDERIREMIEGCERMKIKFGRKTFDMYSFIVGILWCEEHPSKETIFKAIDTFCAHDRTMFKNSDIAMIHETLTNKKF